MRARGYGCAAISAAPAARASLKASSRPWSTPHEAPQPDRERVPGAARVGVLDRQLDPWDDDEPVELPRALRLGVERVEVGDEGLGTYMQTVPTRQDVVGDGEHVEARQPVEIHELGRSELPVAPGRVRVELGEKRKVLPCHPRTCSAAAITLRGSKWLRFGTAIVNKAGVLGWDAASPTVSTMWLSELSGRLLSCAGEWPKRRPTEAGEAVFVAKSLQKRQIRRTRRPTGSDRTNCDNDLVAPADVV
jgi:hypothetical protein